MEMERLNPGSWIIYPGSESRTTTTTTTKNSGEKSGSESS